MKDTFTPPRAAHLTAEILAAYVDGGLPQTERDKADAHLAQCRECLSWLANVVRTIAALKAAPCAAVVAFTVALLAVAAPADAQRESIVFTNINDNGQRLDTIVKVMRVVTPAAPVPSSIVTTEVLPANYKTPLGARSYSPPPVAPASSSVRPTPAAQPLYINGVFAGPSPNGLWTSTSIGRPIIDVNIVSTPQRHTISSRQETRK